MALTSRASRQGDDDRSRFERFVEATYLRVSGPGMFFLCCAIVVAWFVSVPLWVDLKAWQVAIHTVGSVLTLLLLVLLENASRRAEEAAQEKLNVIAEALAALMDSRARDDEELREAAGRLRESVGLEERH
ncbi:low affinity iron permease family protein [Nocardioides donggukensis]|uniref:Low affinity iron permease family protein n=1 Tax=Nocardioides donggukensis TaxID=2774019 RepID=A0A927Q087_9ACTN|nr:low affinity iron permease family protein [Nocardioides donggukensis]MBD8868607.1 low affinity iron permease family protein [Nocardioides donggukensis]